MNSVASRFWAKAAIYGDDDCWPWEGATKGKGYGAFWLNGKPVRAHRVAWALTRPSLPKKPLCVLHRCDNPLCVNPAHLFAGTNQDNCQDMARKGRHGSGKLTESDAYAIIASSKSHADIAAEYGVSHHHVKQLRLGNRWKHLERPPRIKKRRLSPVPKQSTEIERRG